MAHLPGTPTTQLNSASYGWGSKFSPPQLRRVLILYKNATVTFARQQHGSTLASEEHCTAFQLEHTAQCILDLSQTQY